MAELLAAEVQVPTLGEILERKRRIDPDGKLQVRLSDLLTRAELDARAAMLHRAAERPAPRVPEAIEPLTKGQDVIPAMGQHPKLPKTTSVGALLATVFPPQKWVVDRMLTSGLAILGGRPKQGKSFLALQFALAVGAGKEVLGRTTERGHVLYVGLEDGPRRLAQRIGQLGGGADADVALATTWRPLNRGGAQDLEGYILERSPRLIVIDTLARAYAGKLDWNDVGAVTGALGGIQRMAIEHDLAVVVIDHTRKPGVLEGDLVDDVMGSTGKTAVADTVIGLARKRGESAGRLRVVGRDIDDVDIALLFEGGRWKLDSTGGVKPDSLRGLLLAAVEELGAATLAHLVVHTGKNKGTVYRELGAMVDVGLLAQHAEGRTTWYSLSGAERGGQPIQPQQPIQLTQPLQPQQRSQLGCIVAMVAGVSGGAGDDDGPDLWTTGPLEAATT
jgi:hypothetical protein